MWRQVEAHASDTPDVHDATPVIARCRHQIPYARVTGFLGRVTWRWWLDRAYLARNGKLIAWSALIRFEEARPADATFDSGDLYWCGTTAAPVGEADGSVL